MTLEQKMIAGLFALLMGTITYSMDWQREQDEKLSGMDKLLERQQVLLDMQVRYNEQMQIRLIESAIPTRRPEPEQPKVGD